MVGSCRPRGVDTGDRPARVGVVPGCPGRPPGRRPIEDVLTTPSGNAWVGYFDEGVYGNYGWGGPGPEPLGSCGLARFGPGGEQDWWFSTDDAAPIDDCYALNVTGETAWACYYSDFPLVKVEDGEVTAWGNDLAHGAKSLIVDERRVGLAGGYRPVRDRLVIGELGDGELRDAGRYRLVLPDGQPLPDDVRMVGRGPDLHVVRRAPDPPATAAPARPGCGSPAPPRPGPPRRPVRRGAPTGRPRLVGPTA